MRRLATCLLILASTLAFAACGTSGSSAAPTDPANAGGGGSGPCSVVSATGDVAASIAGNAFPADISLSVGQTVTFKNEDAVPHTVTLDDGSCDTDTIAGGASAGLTFSEAGSYPFHCTVHPTMTGTIEVS